MVVYQTSDVKYVIANNQGQPDQQLRTPSCCTQLPGWVVASQPLGSAQDTLNVTVTEFNGRYDGKVIVSGEWLLNHQGQLIKRPFRLEGVQTQDGYDEIEYWPGRGSRYCARDKASTLPTFRSNAGSLHIFCTTDMPV